VGIGVSSIGLFREAAFFTSVVTAIQHKRGFVAYWANHMVALLADVFYFKTPGLKIDDRSRSHD
jgi:hypothetical protein